MRSIKGIGIENLGPIKKLSEMLAPVTLITGANESGKSFILDALEVLRFGTCRGLKVMEANELTRDSAKGWGVTAIVDVEGTSTELRRTRTQKPSDEELVRVLGDARAFRALLHVETFLYLSPDERRMMAADLVAKDTTELVATLTRLEADPSVIRLVEAGNVKAAHALATKIRRAKANEAKALGVKAQVPASPVVPTKAGERPVSDIPHALIVKALAKADKVYEVALSGYGASSSVSTALERAADARKALDDMGSPSWADEDDLELAEASRERQKNRSQAAALAAQHTRATAEIKQLKKLLELGEECPTCGQSMKGAKDAVNARIGELTGEANSAFKAQQKLAKEDEALEQRQRDLEGLRLQAQRADVVRRQLENTIAMADGVVAPKETYTEEEVQAARKEVQRLRHVLQVRESFDARVSEGEGAKEALSETLAQVTALERVEDLTDPSRMDAEAEVLEVLRDSLHRFSTALLGGPVVDIGPAWEVFIRGRNVSLSSDSVRIRAGVCCALALASLSKIGVVCIDRLESLDESARPKLVSLLGKLTKSGELGTALLALVREEVKPLPKVAWLKGIYMKDGVAAMEVAGKGDQGASG